jgi:hypothetical protein
MEFQKDEALIKVLHHHPTLFVKRGVGVLLAILPFLLVAGFFSALLDIGQNLILFGSIGTLFVLYLVYDQVLYNLDRIILTNKRVIHIDWINAFKLNEVEVALNDIEEIKIIESGILSSIPFLDFGTIILETASRDVSITFTDSPNPDRIRDLIYHLSIKPNKIGATGHTPREADFIPNELSAERISLNTVNDPTGDRNREEVTSI